MDEAQIQIRMALDARMPVLLGEIRRLLVERPFRFHPGADRLAVSAIHFEYDWLALRVMACPQDESAAYCACSEPLVLLVRQGDALIPVSIEEALLQAVSEEEQEHNQEQLHMIVIEAFLDWFRRAWLHARDAAPSVRGLLSVHDSIWRMDLDSGKESRLDTGSAAP